MGTNAQLTFTAPEGQVFTLYDYKGDYRIHMPFIQRMTLKNSQKFSMKKSLMQSLRHASQFGLPRASNIRRWDREPGPHHSCMALNRS